MDWVWKYVLELNIEKCVALYRFLETELAESVYIPRINIDASTLL
jgi:hypothetical protein